MQIKIPNVKFEFLQKCRYYKIIKLVTYNVSKIYKNPKLTEKMYEKP